jgi:hypothetical protein
MTKKTAINLKRQRDSYIRKIERDILKKYPTAKFDVSRGPGLKRAYINVAAPTDNHFNVLDAVGDEWIDAIERGFYFYILPSKMENR